MWAPARVLLRLSWGTVPRLRLALPLLLLLPLLLPAAPLHAEHAYEGRRLHVRGEVPEVWIERAVVCADALFRDLSAHFGRTPTDADQPLQLVLYPDRAAWRAALERAGVRIDLGHAGGYTLWEKGISHVFLQKDEWHTRRLILHELTHQFHAKCRPLARRGRGAWWYREGLAEYFAWHAHSDTGLRLGVMDDWAHQGTVPEARVRAAAPDFDPWAIATGTTRASYGDALAVLAALLAGCDADLHARYRAWEQEILGRGGDTASFARHFEGREAALARCVAAYWKSAGPAWRPRGGGWSQEPAAIVGTSDAPALLLRSPVRSSRMKAGVAPAEGAAAGLCLLGQAREVAALVVPGAVVIWDRRPDKGQPLWREVTRIPLPGDGPARIELWWKTEQQTRWRFTCARDGQEVMWPREGMPVGLLAGRAPPRTGLLVRGGRAVFQDLGLLPEED
jgi:hypothetical protein